MLLIVPQITFQDIWLLRDPVAYDVKYRRTTFPGARCARDRIGGWAQPSQGT